jgi:16S rRNA (uracil1498-N3)-methyltransferase
MTATMQRFFVTFPLSIDLTLSDKDIVHQLTRVMRIKAGESIVLFDGDGSENTYEIVAITKNSLSLRGKDRIFPKTEPEKSISLYQALPNKLEKLEYIIQK